MLPFIVRRLALSVFVLFCVVTATFFILNLSSDPISAALEGTAAGPADIAALKEKLGYDKPLLVRYALFMGDLLQGDFGTSIRYGQQSLGLVMERVPYTLHLGGVALLITLLCALPLGIFAAIGKGGWVDRGLAILSGVGQSVPHFVLGPLLILLFAVALGWLPVSGATKPGAVLLPAMTLALYPLVRIARVLRASMLETANEDFVVTARAKGLSPARVVLVHVLRNALLPVLTILGLQIVALLGGTVIVESVFNWPGVGSFARDALLNSDIPLAQTVIIFIAAAVVTINLVTDILYSLVDPRIRYG